MFGRSRFVLFAIACLIVSQGTLAQAQPEPGTIGIYLDPGGTVSIDGWRPGGYLHDDLWDIDEWGAVVYTVHILGLDLPEEIQSFAFGLKPYEFSARFSSEEFPAGATWEHWTTPTSGNFGMTQTNYFVELENCLPAEGLVELARISVRIPFYYWSPIVVLDHATDAATSNSLGYQSCGYTTPLGPWTAFEISDYWAGVSFPDAGEASSWGQVKSLYRR